MKNVKLSRNDYIILFAITALFLFLGISSAMYHPVYSDEPNHLASGFSKLTIFDFRLNTVVPPLANMISALPLLPFDLMDYRNSDAWKENKMNEYSCFVTYKNIIPSNVIIFFGRLPELLMAVLLGLFIFYLIARLYGTTAAHIVYFIYALHPMILTNGTTIFVDFAFTFFNFLTFIVLLKFIKTNKNRWLYAFFIMFSLAFMTKFTALQNFIFYPLLIVLNYKSIMSWFHKNKKKIVWHLIAGAAILYVIILAGYGFQNIFIPTKEAFSKDTLVTSDLKYIEATKLFESSPVFRTLGNIPNPFPYQLTKGIASWVMDSQTATSEKFASLPSLFQKNTIPVIILFLASIVMLLARWKKSSSFEKNCAYYFLFYTIMFNLFGSYDQPRHVLMVYPIMIVMLAKPLKAIITSKIKLMYKVAIIGMLLIWHALAVITTFPDFHNFQSGFVKIFGKAIDDMPLTQGPQFC